MKASGNDIDALLSRSLKAISSHTFVVKPDLSGCGKEIGNAAGDILRYSAQSFANAADSSEYNQDLRRGMGATARNMGDALGNFNVEAKQGLFPEMGTTARGFFGSIINTRNTFQFGGLIALSLAVIATGYYLTKFVWEVISHKVFHPQPVILLPDTKYGRFARFKRWWKGYKIPAMIFDQQVKDRLLEIEQKTLSICTHNKKRVNKHSKMAYDNLLLHGKPGTGKTLFARILADKTDMDFISTTAASLLQSGVAGVKYFNDIMDMARRSAYGTIIFIDEADALFVDRNTLSPDSDHYKVLSHILALTGEGNGSFMLIAATNHAYVMDDAMGRRFQDRVFMPLPGDDTRKELIDLYAQSMLFDIKKNGKLFVKTAQDLLAPDVIDHMVGVTGGLSHAQIKDMVEAMHKKACASETGIITKIHIKHAVDQAIEKQKSSQEDQKKKKARFNVYAAAS